MAKHNVPAVPSSLVGRDGDVAAVAYLLGTSRLVTVTGAPGVGKSRVALQAATGVLDAYPVGIRG